MMCGVAQAGPALTARGADPPDTCYVLSFAIIMLNTSLHNHNVRDKPTAERFVTMNRGINEGGDLPEELLRVSHPAVSPHVPHLPPVSPLSCPHLCAQERQALPLRPSRRPLESPGAPLGASRGGWSRSA